jgi:hypothetical protein
MPVIGRIFRGLSRARRFRPFRDHEFEQEFTVAFRSAGIRFIYVASILLASAMGCFIVIGFAEGKGLFGAPQPTRVALGLLLVGFAYLSRIHRQILLARYELFGSVMLLVGIGTERYIAFKSSINESVRCCIGHSHRHPSLITIVIFWIHAAGAAHNRALGSLQHRRCRYLPPF